MTLLIIIACLCLLVAPLLWCGGFIWEQDTETALDQ